MFGSQLNAGQGGILSGASYAYIGLLTTDLNSNGTVEPNEVSNTRIAFSGFDPANPTATQSFNQVSDDLSPARTHEVILGLDRELMANFGVSASVSYRKFTNMHWQPLIGVRRPDYRQDGVISGTLPTGASYSVPYYALDSAAKIPTGGGTILENREGYHQRYMGFEVQGTKRMSNNYMFRVGFSVNDHREYFTNPDTAIQDPTPTQASPYKDGGLVIRQTGGSGKSQVFLVPPKYQFIANGLYQAPWGINLATNLVTRQGYGMPYYTRNVATTDPFSRLKNVSAVTDIDEFRLPSVTSLDARIGKAFTFGRTNFNFDIDICKITNTNTVLGRQYDLTATGRFSADRVLEIMNPRIVRLGLRMNFWYASWWALSPRPPAFHGPGCLRGRPRDCSFPAREAPMHPLLRAAILIAMSVALLSTHASAQGWKGMGRVAGKVTDESGQTLEGVLVKAYLPAEQGGTEVKSNKSGEWALSGISRGQWQIDFEKDGYESRQVTVGISELARLPPMTIVLKKAAPVVDANAEIRDAP